MSKVKTVNRLDRIFNKSQDSNKEKVKSSEQMNNEMTSTGLGDDHNQSSESNQQDKDAGHDSRRHEGQGIPGV